MPVPFYRDIHSVCIADRIIHPDLMKRAKKFTEQPESFDFEAAQCLIEQLTSASLEAESDYDRSKRQLIMFRTYFAKWSPFFGEIRKKNEAFEKAKKGGGA